MTSFPGAPGSVGPPSVAVTKGAAMARSLDGPSGPGRHSAPATVPGSTRHGPISPIQRSVRRVPARSTRVQPFSRCRRWPTAHALKPPRTSKRSRAVLAARVFPLHGNGRAPLRRSPTRYTQRGQKLRILDLTRFLHANRIHFAGKR